MLFVKCIRNMPRASKDSLVFWSIVGGRRHSAEDVERDASEQQLDALVSKWKVASSRDHPHLHSVLPASSVLMVTEVTLFFSGI